MAIEYRNVIGNGLRVTGSQNGQWPNYPSTEAVKWHMNGYSPNFTIVAIVRPVSTDSSATMISGTRAGFGRSENLSFTDNKLVFRINTNGIPNGRLIYTSDKIFPLNKTHCIAVRRSGSSIELLDQGEVIPSSISGNFTTLDLYSSLGNLSTQGIGRRYLNLTTGDIDYYHLAYYQESLTNDQLADIANLVKGYKNNTPSAIWDFNQTSGDTVFDISGNNEHITLQEYNTSELSYGGGSRIDEFGNIAV